MKKLRIIFLSGIFILMSSWCFADIVAFSNLNSGTPVYDLNAAYVIGGQTQGEGFSPSATVTLTTINIPLFKWNSIGNSDTIITLYESENTILGKALESWTVNTNGLALYPSSNPSLTSLNSVTNTTLVAGKNYWLIASAGGTSYNTLWYFNNISGLGVHYSYHKDDDDTLYIENYTQGAFEVKGNATPIPAALWLFGTGLLGLMGIRRKLGK